MYNSKLAVAIKSNGKVLREVGENVFLPFGSEYSIFIKNLNTVRALVKIEIDGDDIGNGTQLVVGPNSSIDLERFIRNNKSKGNKFKFIERTAGVEKHRGVKVEDGLIRVEFKFERQVVPTTTTWATTHGNMSDYVVYRSLTCDVSATYTANSADGLLSNAVHDTNDVGITVPGSLSDQAFVDSDWFPTETVSHVIVLKLPGETRDNVQVREPVTVKTKATCITCGRKNKITAKFCTECGTSLQVI